MRGLHESNGRVLGSGRYLADVNLTCDFINQRRISEGAADVNSETISEGHMFYPFP